MLGRLMVGPTTLDRSILVQIQAKQPYFDKLSIMYTVYILECDKAFFYVGMTKNMSHRLTQHRRKENNYTRRFQKIDLVFTEEYEFRKDAEFRELQIKKWTKEKKKALITGDIKKLINLSNSHTEVVEV